MGNSSLLPMQPFCTTVLNLITQHLKCLASLAIVSTGPGGVCARRVVNGQEFQQNVKVRHVALLRHSFTRLSALSVAFDVLSQQCGEKAQATELGATLFMRKGREGLKA